MSFPHLAAHMVQMDYPPANPARTQPPPAPHKATSKATAKVKKPTRTFGVSKSSGHSFVCDLASALSINKQIMVPQSGGSLKRRTVLRLGTPFTKNDKLFVYGYLSDGFRTTPMLKADGWTPRQIALLGPADATRPNPVRPRGAPVRLWSDATVAKTKRTKAFQTLVRTSAEVEKAQASAEKAVQTKLAKTTAVLASLKVDVKLQPNNKVLHSAILSFNRRADARPRYGDLREEASVHSDALFLERIQVNYIRHHLTHYDDHHDTLDGLVGNATARVLMGEKVFAQISKTYPHLSAEVRRQVQRRQNEGAMHDYVTQHHNTRSYK